METRWPFKLLVGGVELTGGFKFELSGGTRRQREHAAERALSHFRRRLESRVADAGRFTDAPSTSPGLEQRQAAAEEALEFFRRAIEAHAAADLARIVGYAGGSAGKAVITDDPVQRALQRVVDAGPVSIDAFVSGVARRGGNG